MTSRFSDLDRPPLRSASLTRALVREGSFWREVRVVESALSTNALVGDASSEAEGLVVVAEHQTAGRGRLDRTWSSPPRAGLTFSVLLHAPVDEARLPWLTLAVGVAVAEATEEMAGIPIRLKWPNDVLVADKKLGGILAERRDGAVVVGIGLNVTTTQDELPGPEATSLRLADAAVTDRESLLRAVLRAIADRYLEWRDGRDLAALRSAYAERCATIGVAVKVALPNGSTLEGTARRIDHSGRLVVAADDGEHALNSGDVMHVRPA